MAQLKRTTDTWDELTAAGVDLADTAIKIGESAVAAGAVIGHRVALGAQALQDPLNADPSEFARMSVEKLAAFAASTHAVFNECQSIQHEWMKFSVGQTEGCLRAVWEVAMAWSPQQVLAAQGRWAATSLAQANSHAVKVTTLSAGLSGLAVAPMHETVTENARRLAAAPDDRGGRPGQGGDPPLQILPDGD
jgi:hypothetical protein